MLLNLCVGCVFLLSWVVVGWCLSESGLVGWYCPALADCALFFLLVDCAVACAPSPSKSSCGLFFSSSRVIGWITLCLACGLFLPTCFSLMVVPPCLRCIGLGCVVGCCAPTFVYKFGCGLFLEGILLLVLSVPLLGL